MPPKTFAGRSYRTSSPGRVIRDFNVPARPVADEPRRRRPDWLLLLVAGLLFITLFIAWMVDLPEFLRQF